MVTFLLQPGVVFVMIRKREKAGENMDKKSRPIAVFDSGVGGISVLRELVKLMPRDLKQLRKVNQYPKVLIINMDQGMVTTHSGKPCSTGMITHVSHVINLLSKMVLSLECITSALRQATVQIV